MSIPVKLEAFEGPLDLLLHLIDKNKVDIYDIPIVEITEQYMEYIRAMKERDLNIVSEFLVMAATLLSIKAKMLLPQEVDEDGEEIDPRDELVQKLIEYKMYKYMSFELKDRQLYAGKSVYKQPTLPKEVLDYKEPVNYDELLSNVDLEKLNSIFSEIVKRFSLRADAKNGGFGTIEMEEVSIDEKMDYVIDYAKRNSRFSFRDLLQRQNSKAELIVTFLSILELMKTGEIHIRQDNIFDDIIITSEIVE